jgi:hypothetical protein
MRDTKSAILERIGDNAQKVAWTPRDFADLGSRDTVDKTLQRLTRSGKLRRIGRGLYDQPSFNSLTQKNNPPDPREVIDAIARRDQIRVLVDGMTAANDLGLTNAVPARIVVHSEARRRTIKLGQLEIQFKPTAASKLYWAGRPAMRIVQALHWLKDTVDQRDEKEKLVRQLKAIIYAQEGSKAIRDDLQDGLSTLPTWMQELLGTLLNESENQ